MWMIWLMVSTFLGLSALAFYGWWHNRQVDKYNAWLKQQKEQENNIAQA